MCVISCADGSDSATLLDCSPPGSSVHGIFQERILERLIFSSPGDLPDSEIEPISPVSPAGGSLPVEPSRIKPCIERTTKSSKVHRHPYTHNLI